MTVQAEVDLGIELGAKIDCLTDEVRKLRQRQDRLVQSVHPFVVSGAPISLSAGAGTLNQPNILSPMTGYYWDVKRITCSGFTAGTVSVYLNSTSGDQVAGFTVAGSLFLGKAHLLVQAGENLVFSATGITGTVSVQVAGVEVAAPIIGDYLL